MSELNNLFTSTHRYLISYTAYAGRQDEFEIQGENCWVVSDHELTGGEIAAEVMQHIQEQDDIPVGQVILHKIGALTASTLQKSLPEIDRDR